MTTDVAEAGVRGGGAVDLTPRGPVIIEWPAPRGSGQPMPGWGVAIYDAVTGAQMFNVMRAVLVSAEPSDLVTADLTMLAGEDGNPATEPRLRDGEVVTGVFRFYVAEMRVRAQS